MKRARDRGLLALARPGAALLLTLACAGCDDVERREPARPPLPDVRELVFEGPREIVTRDGLFEISWTPSDGRLPVNEHFEVDVRVARNDDSKTPVTGAELSMSCFMPAHGHGTLTEPKAEEIGDGAYRVRGLLLHMGGNWTVGITATVEGLASTADDEVEL